MKYYIINIFARVIKRKMEIDSSLVLDDIFANDYPSLSQSEKDEIGLKLNE